MGHLFERCVHAQSLSPVQLFETLWAVACQAPLFMGFSGKNAGVSCHFLLQGIFLNPGLNPHILCLLHWQVEFFTTEPLGSPLKMQNSQVPRAKT